ncbi:hypothetical protein BV898_10578 [Hypsibius exemplaris]|nr:hypothetical protein BV898_10578 [Hypsibius exemplaris]
MKSNKSRCCWDNVDLGFGGPEVAGASTNLTLQAEAPSPLLHLQSLLPGEGRDKRRYADVNRTTGDDCRTSPASGAGSG